MKTKEETAAASTANQAPESPGAPKFKPPKKKRKWVKRLIIAAAVAVVLALLLRGCLSGGGQTVGQSAYVVQNVGYQDMSLRVPGSGAIEPNAAYRLTTLISGEILEAPFQEGDTVHKGDVLYRIDASDAETAIEQAEISVRNAQLSLESARLNYQELLDTQSDARENLQVKATDTGVVSKLYVDQGDQVTAGSPIADILDRDHMKLTVSFHAVDAAGFSVGQSAAVRVDGTGETLTGTVDSIAATDSVGAGGALVRSVTILVTNPGALSDSATGTASVGEADCAAGGSFAYAASSQVVAKTSGELTSLTVREGDRVTENQVIAAFEETDMAAQIENARISVSNAQLALENAQLSLESAQKRLEDYTITSPIDGTVIEKNLDVGDNINGSNTTASTGVTYPAVIYDLSALTFDMSINELDISQIQVGQTVEITSQAVEGRTFTGHVQTININGITTNGSTSYPVTVQVDDPDGLLPGMNVSAEIVVQDEGQALCVPIAAVERGESGGVVLVPGEGSLAEDGVTVADPSKLEKRQVTLGRSNDQYVEIVSGLSEGDAIIVEMEAGSSLMNMLTVTG
ncbi:efflux RND transporter periplasmic adaptor subunit [Pseudoflavonifractor phocaeensis]|uniref:efflux RND transporter periplasmic adaptor subunit n=1 Tax=Pseudoflavonifractor phocaeensis TaxID=1870988 RepID=UPI00195C938F|nr:efflux RND transporter periplasmic adaptor subunit [Pseudoflavonifractor phocaeensis]MBM6870022.1 efflux RND transporter periplasmic adaptor subunit [Pseudoflavonifractor phocaeensis]